MLSFFRVEIESIFQGGRLFRLWRLNPALIPYPIPCPPASFRLWAATGNPKSFFDASGREPETSPSSPIHIEHPGQIQLSVGGDSNLKHLASGLGPSSTLAEAGRWTYNSSGADYAIFLLALKFSCGAGLKQLRSI
ncbi:hypothetical protein DSO57_1008014 [Entomophthora muscae]|uniref:Uncharacterized protein n=1 Tax=Entomophthora muscae TaxID=34485 RepID=A0ACC2USN3_9FUNG|nr:hypothetical protein DSO57_1008014 [Entomophthora muscae]